MGIVDLLKLRPSFESQIEKLDGVTVVETAHSEHIAFSSSTTTESIKSLLTLLRVYKIAFSFHDSFYPSPSDPGAYIDYSQEQNERETTWSMTLGNHGWSGGIYSIEEATIVIQLLDLVNQKLLKSIRIDRVRIFAHYDKMSLDANKRQNALIFELHKNTGPLSI